MALETLVRSQIAAAEFYGVNPDELGELQVASLHKLGQIVVGDVVGFAYRAYCGPQESIGKGGIRMAPYPSERLAISTVGELAAEMNAKLALRNHKTFRGAKGLINIDARALTYPERADAMRQYADLMHAAGLAGGDKDVPAGDVGTNGLADVYAAEYHNLDPRDSCWQASITGKSPGMGGLPFRTAATGWGGYVAQRTILDKMAERPSRPITTNFQGAGNVGGWHAHFASEDPGMRVGAISDVGGTLYTNDPAGFHITEQMVREISDNPRFTGSKVHALAEQLRKDGHSVEIDSDPNALLCMDTDHLVLAAMGDVLKPENVRDLNVRHAIIEDANGPTHPLAHEYLVRAGITVLPDITANGGGVDCSITEHATNMAMAKGLLTGPPSDAEVQKNLATSTETLVHQMLEMAERMQEVNRGNPDLRAASAALSMGRLLVANGWNLRRGVAELINA